MGGAFDTLLFRYTAGRYHGCITVSMGDWRYPWTIDELFVALLLTSPNVKLGYVVHN